MSKTIRLFAAFVIAAVGLAACSDSSGTRTGVLTVRLTDAPFPFSDVASVKVCVLRVDAKMGATTEEEAADENDNDGWVTVASPNASACQINLLDYSGGKTLTLGATPLPVGTYQSFRLILDTDKSVITLKDGTTPPIFFPSAAHTGIKVILDEPVTLTGSGSLLLLDFDVGRSFVMRGNSAANGFNFKPVIHAIGQEIVTGSVSGSVHANTATGPAVAGATVEVLTAGSLLTDADPAHIVATTVTDANGNFTIAFLIPGTYVLRATPPAASGFKPALLTGGLTITAGSVTADQVIVVAP